MKAAQWDWEMEGGKKRSYINTTLKAAPSSAIDLCKFSPQFMSAELASKLDST